MREIFTAKRFRGESLVMIDHVNTILAEYAKQGFTLTIRQLYYQLVARALIPNDLQSYKRTVSLVGDARLAGLIDWAMITDRNRECQQVATWESPADIVDAAATQFMTDLWEDQPYHIEVMVEKDALSGVLWPVCQQSRIGLTACKGYNSLSNMYEAGKRLKARRDDGKTVIVLYLGDHDPSGLDMTRDVTDRLTLFADEDIYVNRIALNMDQVDELNPPENPAKTTDSRFQAYADRYGESSWELDALEPRYLANLIEQEVASIQEPETWLAAKAQETKMRSDLRDFARQYRKTNSQAK